MELVTIKRKELEEERENLNSYARELEGFSKKWSDYSQRLETLFVREAERREFAEKVELARRDAVERKRDRAFREDLMYSIYLGIIWGISFGMLAGYFLWSWARGELKPPTAIGGALWGIAATILPLLGVALSLTSYRIFERIKKLNFLSASLGTLALGAIFGAIVSTFGLPIRSIALGSVSFSLFFGGLGFLFAILLALQRGERAIRAFNAGSKVLPLMLTIGGIIGLIAGGVIPLAPNLKDIKFSYILTIPNFILWATIIWFIGDYVKYGGCIKELFAVK